MDLCKFIDEAFYEINEEVKESPVLIGCEESERDDLKRLGFEFEG